MDQLRPVRGTPAEVVDALRAWLAAGEEPPPLVVETSGSTGTPKHVVLTRRAVLASVEASGARLGGTGRWVLAVPPTYVAGVQVICRSLVAGHEPVLLGRRSFAAAAVVAGLDPPAYTSLVPTQLHRLLDEPDAVAALRTFAAVLVGGAPMDALLRGRAEAAGVRMVTTYGAAETAGGCVYDGRPLDGVRVELEPDGRIRIAGPMLFERYDGDPARTARALVDGWYRSEDRGQFSPQGHLRVLGRLDDMVISGGTKIPLSAVESRLREHPDVVDVAVVGVPDVEWGQRVVAYVVLAGAPVGQPADGRLDGLRERLRDWVADGQPRAWAPRTVVALPQLPLLASGKVDREALRARG